MLFNIFIYLYHTLSISGIIYPLSRSSTGYRKYNMLDIMDISINFTPATTKCCAARVDCHCHKMLLPTNRDRAQERREEVEKERNMGKLHLHVARRLWEAKKEE